MTEDQLTHKPRWARRDGKPVPREATPGMRAGLAYHLVMERAMRERIQQRRLERRQKGL